MSKKLIETLLIPVKHDIEWRKGYLFKINQYYETRELVLVLVRMMLTFH